MLSPNLGLSPSDQTKVLNETNIIFHMAATIRFNAPLKTAINMNVLGTQKVIELAKQMTNLVAFVHVSTAFSCCDQKVTEERVYDWPHDPSSMIKCAEWMDESLLNTMSSTLLMKQPNTYTYTKRLAEILINKEYSCLPVCIVRPSIGMLIFDENVYGNCFLIELNCIVYPAYCEPLLGWTDSFNGFGGLSVRYYI